MSFLLVAGGSGALKTKKLPRFHRNRGSSGYDCPVTWLSWHDECRAGLEVQAGIVQPAILGHVDDAQLVDPLPAQTLNSAMPWKEVSAVSWKAVPSGKVHSAVTAAPGTMDRLASRIWIIPQPGRAHGASARCRPTGHG